MTSEEITGLSATALADAIRDRRVSSVGAVEIALARIERFQPVVNAFIRVEADAALAAAAETDRRIAAGEAVGPLAGVPLAHKDMYYRAGRPSTAGSRIRRDFVPEVTSTALERLDGTGAIDLGGLNMAEFAAGPTGHNEHYGDACNPWNPAHITGGSSSGSGAAVAARLVWGALGSDTGGSVRLPAAACGVVGIKPTWGRVSRYALVPRSWSLDCVGPLTRTVADCAAMLRAIAGADASDPTAAGEPVPDYVALLGRGAAGLRVGLPAKEALGEIDGEVRAAHEEAVSVLRAQGIETRPVPLPDLALLWDLGDTISKAESATMHLEWMQSRPQDFGRQVMARTEVGIHIPAVRYLQAMTLRARFLEEFVSTALSEVDAVLLPVIPFPVPTRAETDVREAGAVPGMVGAMTRWTRPINYLGLPALSLPCGFTGSGLPTAFQLVGRPFAEATLFRLGHAYEQATDWHRAVPAGFA